MEVTQDTAVPEPVLQLLEQRASLVRELMEPRWTPKRKEVVRDHLKGLADLRGKVEKRHMGYLGGREVMDDILALEEEAAKRLGTKVA